MPGYSETYLQGLQHLVPGIMQQRRLSDYEANQNFQQRLHAQGLQREFDAQRMRQLQYEMNQQRQYEAMKRLQDQRHFGNVLALENLGLHKKQVDQPHLGPVMEVVGPGNKVLQVRSDSKGSGWYTADTNEKLPEGVQGQLRVPKPLPVAEKNALEKGASNLQAHIALLKSFKPNYAGDILPVLGEVQKAWSGYVPGTDSGMANWWREYQRLSKNPERHGIAGSALTPREINQFEAGDIGPALKSDDVVGFLNRKIALLQRGVARHANSAANRYHPREIEYSMGMPIPPDPTKSPNSFDLKQLTQEGARISGVGRPPIEDLMTPQQEPQ